MFSPHNRTYAIPSAGGVCNPVYIASAGGVCNPVYSAYYVGIRKKTRKS